MAVFYVLSIVYLVALVSANGFQNESHICCGETVKKVSESSGICCGGDHFDDKTQICCEDLVTVPKEDGDDSCCIDFRKVEEITITTYNSSKARCCDGELQKLSDTGDFELCCGTDLYNLKTHICCDDKIHALEVNKECCGKEYYDESTQLCDDVLDTKEHKYVPTLVAIPNNHTDMCNTTLFDVHTHTCHWSRKLDHEILVDKDPSLRDEQFTGCCEDPQGNVKTYNQVTHACCEHSGIVIPIPADQQESEEAQCCNGKIFVNDTWFECCEDNLIQRDEEYGGSCCGGKLLQNFNTHFCCNNVIEPQNDKETLTCCDDKVIMDTATHTCCNGVKEGGADFECCDFGDNECIYNINEEKCSSEHGVVKLNEEEKAKMASLDPLCPIPDFY